MAKKQKGMSNLKSQVSRVVKKAEKEMSPAERLGHAWKSALASGGKLDKTKDFLYQFFSVFDEDMNNEITPDVIEKRMINEARVNPLINVSKEHIEKVLSLPKNKLTEKQIRDEFHISLADSLM